VQHDLNKSASGKFSYKGDEMDEENYEIAHARMLRS